MHHALREALQVCSETDPRELDQDGLALWRECDDRCAAIIERLIREHDECGPAARALLARFSTNRS